MSHIGIRLRISLPSGQPLVDVDSDLLYMRSKMDQGNEWRELLRTVDGLLIETQAVELPDEYPDPDEEPQT